LAKILAHIVRSCAPFFLPSAPFFHPSRGSSTLLCLLIGVQSRYPAKSARVGYGTEVKAAVISSISLTIASNGKRTFSLFLARGQTFGPSELPHVFQDTSRSFLASSRLVRNCYWRLGWVSKVGLSVRFFFFRPFHSSVAFSRFSPPLFRRFENPCCNDPLWSPPQVISFSSFAAS